MSDHTHDARDIRGGAEERHYHRSHELYDVPSDADLAKVASDVSDLERRVNELEAQLRAEQITVQALKKSSLNAVSFVQILRLNSASLRETARHMQRQGADGYSAMILLADLLDSISDSTESEIPK